MGTEREEGLPEDTEKKRADQEIGGPGSYLMAGASDVGIPLGGGVLAETGRVEHTPRKELDGVVLK